MNWKYPSFPWRFVALNVAVLFAATNSSAESVSFNKDIRPILSENCYACHGPDAESREADLRLDIEAHAFESHGKFDPAIVRGNPAESPLYQRITTSDEDDVMPPPDSNKSLNVEEIELIAQWIQEGANWEGHWAFVPPQKPVVPSTSWGNNEIDAFLHEAMLTKGLAPNERADRPTLARRLALDLTGLPPTPELVEAFVSDTSANAYERLVDKLLDSSAYGEHQARIWLDAARYADTHGLHLDNYREIWPYRDWVVKAFNQNKPFDQFTVEQIAGDLLPGATLDQRLATGFNRCNPTTSEGGAIDEEYRAIYAKDRVETTATVFLGLTMGCASCHDHKFDPFTMTDFYRFSAFFNNFDGPIMDGNAYDTRPVVTIPKPEHTNEWIQVSKERDVLTKAVSKLKKERKNDFENWKSNPDRNYKTFNLNTEVAFELRVNADSEDQEAEETESDETSPQAIIVSMGEQIDLAQQGFRFNPDKPFTLSCELKLPVEEGQKQARIPVLEQFDGNRGWRLAIANSNPTFPNRYQITFELIHSLKDDNLIAATTKSERVNPREFSNTTINVKYDGSGSVGGLTISTGSRQPFNYSKVVDNLSGNVSVDAPLIAGHFSTGLIDPELAAKTYKSGYYDKSSEGPKTGRIKSVKFYNRPIYAFESTSTATVKRVKALLKTPEERLRDRDKEQIETYYYTNFIPEYREFKYKEAINEMRYNHIYDQATVSLVMEESDSLPTAHILERGEYDKPGEEVFADVPESLGSLPADAPKNRLGLAKWLIDPQNPLTARVTVNRFWQNIFGTGIVATSEDFGIMGENPSHPELLDWLAVSFQESGWDVKSIFKSMVMSAAYQQTSTIDPEELAMDRENRYLARGPRYRLDGEVLRDEVLFVSGSMNSEIGGPPVKPYQPDGIWNAVAYSDSNTAHFFQDSGEALYRRSLYTFWKRTAPPPNMVVFDVPSRENCNVRRERTNTPLQALTLMNDPQFVEAARKLAERVMSRYDGPVSNRINQMYTYAFGSAPIDKHREILERSYQKFYSSFVEGRSNARDFIQVGDSAPKPNLDPIELASLTMVANQIMNLDSFITKYQIDPMSPIDEYVSFETRRQFLGKAAKGLGIAALASITGPGLRGNVFKSPGFGPGSLGTTHFPAKAKRGIYLFMSGAPSQLDMYDYKPEMRSMFDKDLPDSVRRGQRLTTMTSAQARFPIAPSIFDFEQVGNSGAWISELLPYTKKIVDEIAIVKSMWTEAINHDPAITYIQTGNQIPGRPSLGAWISYGLGSLNENLPTFVVLNSTWTGRKEAQALFSRLWGAGPLPSEHQGVSLRSKGDPVLYLTDPHGVSRETRRDMLDGVNEINEDLYHEFGDPETHARISQYEMAFRMQSSVPELTDLSDEPDYIFDLYGPDAKVPGTFAYNCLMARRLAEKGVRFSQIFHRGWDQHGVLPKDLPNQCKDVDQASYALITDLKQRGMLDDTLVIWGGEFGRTLYCQGTLTETNYGRDHHPRCYTKWMAGAGVKGGMVYGETDDFGYNIVKDPVHIRDLNATILNRFGVDHKRLSFKHQGLDLRLTGVEDARVVNQILSQRLSNKAVQASFPSGAASFFFPPGCVVAEGKAVRALAPRLRFARS